MRRAIVAATLVLSGCAGFIQPSSAARICDSRDTSDGVNVYIFQGVQPVCRVSATQRYIVQMFRANGSDDSLRAVCLGPWHAESFIVNFANLDYCVYQKGRLI